MEVAFCIEDVITKNIINGARGISNLASLTLQAIRPSYEQERNFEAAGGPTNGRLSKIESLTLGFSPKEKIFFANIEESGAMRYQIRSSF